MQESKEASGTQPAKADWNRNYFAFAILLNTTSISREFFKFSIMLIIIKVFGKKSREIVDLLSRLSLQNDFVPIVSEKLKTNNGGAKWFYYFLPETASALC